MSKNSERRMARRDFLRYAAVGGLGSGLIGLLAACQPAAAPQATQAPKPAATTAPAAPAATTAPAATQASAKAGKVTLNIWQHWSGKLEQTMESHVGEFNQSQSGIEIKLTTVPLTDMWTKVLAAVAAGSPPDTYTSAAMVRPELAQNKAIEDLSKYGKRPDLLKAFDNPTVFMGGWYGVPMNGGLWTLCFNKDLYTRAGLDANTGPQTWDDIVEHGKKLTDPANNQFGIVLPNKPIPWTCEVWYGYLLEAGGDFLSADNSGAAFNAAPGVEALQFWVDLTNKYKYAPQVSLDSNGLRSNYQTGKIGMIPNYPVTMEQIASFNHKSMTTPAPKKARQGTHFAGTYFPFMKGSKNKEQVAKFFEWWVRAENQAKWAVGTGGLPIRQSVTEQPIYKDFLQKQPMAKAFLDSFDFAKPLPMVVGITEMEQVVSEAIELAVYQRATPKEALDRAAQKVDDVIKKYKA